MERIPVLTVGRMLSRAVGDDHARPEVVEGHPTGRKHTRRRQPGAIAGKSSFGKEAAPAMSIPLDLRSTEDHGSHLLQNEADRERVFILCPGHALVKSENGKGDVINGSSSVRCRPGTPERVMREERTERNYSAIF